MKILKIFLILYLFLAVLNSCNTVQHTACPSFNGRGDMRGSKHVAKASRLNFNFKHSSNFKKKHYNRIVKNNLADLNPISAKSNLETFEGTPGLDNPNFQENNFRTGSTDQLGINYTISTEKGIPVRDFESSQSYPDKVSEAVAVKSLKRKSPKRLFAFIADDDINLNAIIGFVFILLGFIAFPGFFIVGVIFCAIAIDQKKGEGKGSGTDLAWAGLIIGMAGILLSVAIIALLVLLPQLL